MHAHVINRFMVVILELTRLAGGAGGTLCLVLPFPERAYIA